MDSGFGAGSLGFRDGLRTDCPLFLGGQRKPGKHLAIGLTFSNSGVPVEGWVPMVRIRVHWGV